MKGCEVENEGTRRAVFLDRDGTLNEDPGYLNDASQLKLLPGVGEALSLLKRAGFLLVVVSNQSGVGRGLIEVQSLCEIHKRLNVLLSPWSVQIDRFELCFHRPDEECECRKPKPKLIQDAAVELKIDLAQSYMIGDRISDLDAGVAAGCKASILVRTGSGDAAVAEIKDQSIMFIGDSLLHAVHWILGQENAGFLKGVDQIQGCGK
jgi:D-glycero-D-manno-heptose 1,7-bisphosphate phosphatase